MVEPGGLRALGTVGRRAWNARLSEYVATARARDGDNPLVLLDPSAETDELTSMEWSGYPARVGSCLTRGKALALLDWRGRDGDEGRARLQEEYCEWRVVHGRERIQRVELTTELADYWRLLAAHAPRRLLELVGAFAREEVIPEAIFGRCDPFATATSAAEREAAFAEVMLAPGRRSAYNNGERAICFMIQPSNSVAALIRLAIAATVPRLIKDADTGKLRCMTGPEASALIPGACQDGRSSDPVALERLSRLAYEGRVVAFDDPLGVYIQAVQAARLRCPDGRLVPQAWFTRSRGHGPERSGGGRSLYQRLSFEVPPAEGFCVGDLVDTATEQRIESGAQIAELVQLIVHLRVSAPGARSVREGPADLDGRTSGPADAAGCASVRAEYAAFAARDVGSPPTREPR